MEVRLELLAERYEQESVVITSELVSSWSDGIFKDPLPAVGAIDRVVHHTMILELVGTIYRADSKADAEGAPEAE